MIMSPPFSFLGPAIKLSLLKLDFSVCLASLCFRHMYLCSTTKGTMQEDTTQFPILSQATLDMNFQCGHLHLMFQPSYSWIFRTTSQQMIRSKLKSDVFEVNFHLNGKLYNIWWKLKGNFITSVFQRALRHYFISTELLWGSEFSSPFHR